jgi:hypothetical protein
MWLFFLTYFNNSYWLSRWKRLSVLEGFYLDDYSGANSENKLPQNHSYFFHFPKLKFSKNANQKRREIHQKHKKTTCFSDFKYPETVVPTHSSTKKRI